MKGKLSHFILVSLIATGLKEIRQLDHAENGSGRLVPHNFLFFEKAL